MLHGRESEQAQIAALLGDARSGRAASLLIRGEPGIGKSALIAHARESADGMQVLTAQGLESEAPLAFAGLQQLLAPVASLIERIPSPQARALRVALGQQDGPTAEPFLVALATLSVLSEAAEESPVLCLIDDAHWLDVASADAILFATRRLAAEAVAVIFTARHGDVRTFNADGVPLLDLTGLAVPAARQLLAERAGASLPDSVAQALLQQTDGNPLALVELPASLSDGQLAGTLPIPAQIQLTDRVQRVFLDRCRRLATEVQTLLLVASADDSGNLAVVTHAAALLGVSAGALVDAERAGLVITDRDTIRVRHPLVRTGIYQAATGHELRSAHRALAQVLGDDPDRQAWHRAAAAEGPDEEVVTALVRMADRAEHRGGFVAAAAGYERAAELCAEERARAELLFGAARNAWTCGQAERARMLAEGARARTDDRVLRADIDRLRGRIEVNVGSASRAHRIFDVAAQAAYADDPVRAVEMWVAATLTRMFDAETSAGPTAGEIPDDAMRPGDSDDVRTRCLKLLLAAAVAAAVPGTDGALESARQLLVAAAEISAEVTDLDVLANLGNTALHLGADRTHHDCFSRVLTHARDRGAGMFVLYALPRLAFADLLSGDWSRVRSAADEACALSTDTGQPTLGAAPLAWLTLLAALQGAADYDALRTRRDEAIGRRSLGVLTDAVHDLSRWADGISSANAGEPGAALQQLSRLRVPAMARMAALDRIEAALRVGDHGLAQIWLEEVDEFAKQTEWPWARAVAAHARALLAEPEDAPALFEGALAYHERGGRPFDHARTHLAYGEFLRRSQRRTDARPHLREALAILGELGAEPLRSRAEQELRASGETARKRDPSTLTLLTPMELQVAHLVAQGMSNKEVAAQCWISPRTVAFHLRNVFSKTGVTSRGELARLGLSG